MLSQNRLESMVDRMGLATGGNSVQQVLKEIWQNARIEPAGTDRSQNETGSGEKPGQGSGVAAFYVEYAASTPQQAQQVCSELTSMLLEEDLRSRAQATASLADSRRQLDEAKRNLDEQDKKLASFKQQHIRQLSGDAESTTTRLMVLNSQLSALSQWINLTQQNKSNAESILAQQPAKQRPPPSPASPAESGRAGEATIGPAKPADAAAGAVHRGPSGCGPDQGRYRGD